MTPAVVTVHSVEFDKVPPEPPKRSICRIGSVTAVSKVTVTVIVPASSEALFSPPSLVVSQVSVTSREEWLCTEALLKNALEVIVPVPELLTEVPAGVANEIEIPTGSPAEVVLVKGPLPLPLQELVSTSAARMPSHSACAAASTASVVSISPVWYSRSQSPP